MRWLPGTLPARSSHSDDSDALTLERPSRSGILPARALADEHLAAQAPRRSGTSPLRHLAAQAPRRSGTSPLAHLAARARADASIHLTDRRRSQVPRQHPPLSIPSKRDLDLVTRDLHDFAGTEAVEAHELVFSIRLRHAIECRGDALDRDAPPRSHRASAVVAPLARRTGQLSEVLP